MRKKLCWNCVRQSLCGEKEINACYQNYIYLHMHKQNYAQPPLKISKTILDAHWSELNWTEQYRCFVLMSLKIHQLHILRTDVYPPNTEYFNGTAVALNRSLLISFIFFLAARNFIKFNDFLLSVDNQSNSVVIFTVLINA